MTDACPGRVVDRWRTVWNCELGDHTGMCGLGVMRWEGPRMPEWVPNAPYAVWRHDGTTAAPDWIRPYGAGPDPEIGHFADFHFVGPTGHRGTDIGPHAVHRGEWVLLYHEPAWDGPADDDRIAVRLEVMPDDKFRARFTHRKAPA